MGQFQSLFFADTSIDANTLIQKTLNEIVDTQSDFRIISLPHDETGADRPYSQADGDQPCLFFCHSRHAAALTVSPCGHRVMCYQCYRQFIENACDHVCPVCKGAITAIN
ncbi:MAG: RING finger protein [Exiguobacterium sp.]|jgi:hypothetical protein